MFPMNLNEIEETSQSGYHYINTPGEYSMTVREAEVVENNYGTSVVVTFADEDNKALKSWYSIEGDNEQMVNMGRSKLKELALAAKVATPSLNKFIPQMLVGKSSTMLR